MSWRCCCLTVAAVLALPLSAVFAQKEFGFDNTKSSGQPYLTPEESVKRLQVPPGWEVKVFAAEPDVINPVAFTVDERGRLWVVECYEYPNRTPPGKAPRDRVKVLEDSDGDGRADKVTVWAEGKDLPRFDLATGIEVGHGGVFLGAAPYLFFLRDTKGAGRCDDCRTLLQGFGSQDTHETLNTFQWGPDGRLYGLQGIFTQSKVDTLEVSSVPESLLYGLHGIFTQSKVDGVQMNAAVWRYDYPHKKFDVYAEGTSNPWGLDFDRHGQAFLACCVIPHLFHMIPGGTYKRQAGNSQNPYAYGLLNEICDHIHHKESGWAHAGTLVLQGDDIPEEYRGSILMGSIHGCSIKCDTLARNGSTFVAHHHPDFLVSGDRNFRPINMRWGPDGSIYVIDWHDQNVCHQAPKDSWDYEHGRIFKIQRTGTGKQAPVDLARKSSRELVELLKNNNPWWHRTALRLLKERRDRSVAPELTELALRSDDDALSLRGLWGLYAIGAFDEAFAEKALGHSSPWVRSWAVRLLGEAGQVSGKVLARFIEMAEKDSAPEVRLQLASTAQRLTGQDTLPLLHQLMQHRQDAKDPDLPLMIWLAYEPRVPKQRSAALDWLRDHAAGNPLVADEIVPRAVRRLVATGKPDDLEACIAFLGAVKDGGVRRRALEGLTQALQGQLVDGPPAWKGVLASLLEDKDAEVQRLARKVAVNFRDPEAVRRAMATARDATKPPAARADAVRDLALARPPEARPLLLDIVRDRTDTDLRAEACRALAGYTGPEVAAGVLKGWKDYPPAVRVEAVNLLAGRKDWAAALLEAVGKKEVPRTDLSASTILRIQALHDKKLDAEVQAVWGKVRDTPAELNALIERMRVELYAGRGSFERGRKVFENTCSKCHKFEGQGHTVGPELDGAGRDIEYLLINVLDPNRVVGQPYIDHFVALNDGRTEHGLIAAEDERSITLKTENDATKVILKKDIDEMSDQGRSIMPEGLAGTMTVQDFRDLVRYVMANPFLTDVAVAGPFEPSAAPPPGNGGGVTWDRPAVGPPGRVPLPACKKEAVAYVAAEVTAPSALRTRLQFGAAQPVQVWLNGKPVYDGRPGEKAVPDEAGVDVELREGTNRLLFRVTYKGDKEVLYARLLDPQRKLRYPEK
jgi:putative membrane-bound dehydrogenase-like protein